MVERKREQEVEDILLKTYRSLVKVEFPENAIRLSKEDDAFILEVEESGTKGNLKLIGQRGKQVILNFWDYDQSKASVPFREQYMRVIRRAFMRFPMTLVAFDDDFSVLFTLSEALEFMNEDDAKDGTSV